MRLTSAVPCLTALVLLGAAAPARAAEKDAAPSPGGRVVDLRDMSCQQYLDVPEADRAPVVWYMAGFYRAKGVQALRFDLDRAATALPKVLETCRARPDASLRYTVRDMLAPPAKEKKGSGKAKAAVSTSTPAKTP